MTVTVHRDEVTDQIGRVVFAEVPARRGGKSIYYVDLIQGLWFCTCWHNTPERPCVHVQDVSTATGAPR